MFNLKFRFNFKSKIDSKKIYLKLDSLFEKSTFIYRSSLILFTFVFSTSCGVNYLGTVSDKDSDAAKLEDAKIYTNNSNWDGAIAKILSMSEDGQASLETKKVLAGAYAGKCGLSFLSFINGLTSPTASGSLFQKLMSAMSSKTPNLDSCNQVESIVKGIGATVDRPSNVNFFFAIYGFAKIGLYLRSLADTDGDSVTDAGYDSCNPADISEDQINEVFTGFGIALENISTVISAIGSSQFGTDVLDLKSDCETALGVGNCNITDVSSVDQNMRDSMRDFLKTSAYGIEACVETGATIPLCC